MTLNGLEFIFDQIITNALKYTPSQSGEIKIYTSEEPQMTYVHIQDNGIGIPATDLPRIFDRGFTGNNGRKNEKATGMGLYLCKTLCDKLISKDFRILCAFKRYHNHHWFSSK